MKIFFEFFKKHLSTLSWSVIIISYVGVVFWYIPTYILVYRWPGQICIFLLTIVLLWVLDYPLAKPMERFSRYLGVKFPSWKYELMSISWIVVILVHGLAFLYGGDQRSEISEDFKSTDRVTTRSDTGYHVQVANMFTRLQGKYLILADCFLKESYITSFTNEDQPAQIFKVSGEIEIVLDPVQSIPLYTDPDRVQLKEKVLKQVTQELEITLKQKLRGCTNPWQLEISVPKMPKEVQQAIFKGSLKLS